MDNKSNVPDSQKVEKSVTSNDSSVDKELSPRCSPLNSKETGSSPSKDCKITSSSDEVVKMLPKAEKNSGSELASAAKVTGGRLSSDSLMRDRECSSDTEKEGSQRKRHKSSDHAQTRHHSVGHRSAVKGHKSLNKSLEEQTEPKATSSSPMAKKKGGNPPYSGTESDLDMPDIMESSEAVSSSNQNGHFSAVGLSLKVPPLKIVLPSGSNTAFDLPESRERCKVVLSKLALPYVVKASESADANMPDSSTADGGKEGGVAKSLEATSKQKEDTTEEQKVQRVTRSSQRIQASHSAHSHSSSSQSSDASNTAFPTSQKAEMSGESSNEDQLHIAVRIHPRKRKLRTKDGSNEGSNSNQAPSSSGSSCNEDSQQPQQQQQQQQILLNSYQMYLNIRKQVDKRRKAMFVVHPKPPQGFKDYLLNRCSYVLEGNAASRLSVPVIPPPQSLEGSIKDLFVHQEKERYRLRLQHLIEREKLVLSTEQETLRVHGQAARAIANQSVPLSVCSILKDEEIYNVLDVDQDDKDKNVRSRFNGRLFLSWLKDVDDKWEKIKEAMLLRHHNEAESLHAVQKLDWEWKMKELSLCDIKTTPVIDDLSVPIVHVSDDFDLLPV